MKATKAWHQYCGSDEAITINNENIMNLAKTHTAMVELVLEYEDENGDVVSEVHDVHPNVKSFYEASLDYAVEAKHEAEYWKRMFEMHITKGVIVN